MRRLYDNSEVAELLDILARLRETRGGLDRLRMGTDEYDRLFSYRLGLHRRRARMMHRETNDTRRKSDNLRLFFNQDTEDDEAR